MNDVLVIDILIRKTWNNCWYNFALGLTTLAVFIFVVSTWSLLEYLSSSDKWLSGFVHLGSETNLLTSNYLTFCNVCSEVTERNSFLHGTKKANYFDFSFVVEERNIIVEGCIVSCNYIPPSREGKEGKGYYITFSSLFSYCWFPSSTEAFPYLHLWWAWVI